MKRLVRWLLGLLLLIGLLGGIGLAVANSSSYNVFHSAYLVLAEDDSWKWSPAVAYSTLHDEYLVVWETWLPGSNHHLIYGRRVGARGQLYPTFVVYDDVNNSLQPAVAYDSTHDRYLVVWSYDSAGDGLDCDIYGRFIPWDGPSDSDLAFGFDNSRTNADKPKLAYSPTEDEFLIVWKVEENPAYIAGGILYYDKPAVALNVISSGPEIRDFPDLTYNLDRNEFVVVWDEDVGRDSQDLDIYAVRLDHDGAPMSPGEFGVSTLIQNEQHPTVTACYAADEYLFAWQQQVNPTSTDDNIFGRVMTGAGALQQSYGLEGSTLPQRYPDLSCNPTGNEFLMVWQDMYAQPALMVGIWGAFFRTNPYTEPPYGEPGFEVVRPSDTRDRLFPAVAYGKMNALVVWQHRRENSGYYDIWGQLTWPHETLLPVLRK